MLYKCVECDHEISDNAYRCPNCGTSDAGERARAAAKARRESSEKPYGCLAIVIFALGLYLSHLGQQINKVGLVVFGLLLALGSGGYCASQYTK